MLGTPSLTFNDDFQRDFPLYVQSIDPPELTTAATQLQSPIGNFTHLNNVSVNSSTNTVQITFMDTENSIHEHAIYVWMEQISNYQTEFIPRVDMVIRVYFSDIRKILSSNKDYDKFGYRLNYMYFFSGCFPTQFETSKLNQAPPNAGTFSRPVTFSFNNMVVLRDNVQAERLKLDHLWTDYELYSELTEYGKRKREAEAVVKEAGSVYLRLKTGQE